MASTADVFLVSLLAAVVPIVLFVLLRKRGGADKGWSALLAALRERRWRTSRSHSSASSAATLHPMLTRVAPSEHGFLPARVPCFSFDNAVLDGFVQVSRGRIEGLGSGCSGVKP